MIEFPIITKIQRIAEEKGLEQGLEKGLEQGLEKGLEKGLEQGRLQAISQSIIDVLETRFGSVPDTITQRLMAMTQINQLKPLVKLAASCPDLGTFQRSL